MLPCMQVCLRSTHTECNVWFKWNHFFQYLQVVQNRRKYCARNMLIMIWTSPVDPYYMWGFKYRNLNSFPRPLWGCRGLSCVPGGVPAGITLRQLTAGSHWESGLVGCQRPYKYSGHRALPLGHLPYFLISSLSPLNLSHRLPYF